MCLTLLPAQSNKKLKPKIENPTLSTSSLKSERYFWLNPDFIEGNLKHKKRRTNTCESILRLRDRARITLCSSQSSALKITQTKKALKKFLSAL
jgi:hypothetical protein